MAVTLVAVVDFSGSMAGAKLRRVKDTLNYMIDNLSDQVGAPQCDGCIERVYVGCMLYVARGCDAAVTRRASRPRADLPDGSVPASPCGEFQSAWIPRAGSMRVLR